MRWVLRSPIPATWPKPDGGKLHGVDVGPELVARTIDEYPILAVAAALAEASLDPPYGLVTVQIGVNNQFTNGDLEVFRTELAGILDSALALAGGDPGRVLVLSIPDWGVTPFAPSLLQGRIAYEVARFNDVVREEVEARSLSLIDVTASSKRAKEDPSLLSFDDLHPSGLMYAEWAELALDAAAEALRSAPSP